ncbi:uncharacterized protein ACIB01_014473 [Guaruba guarouba]
MCCASTHTHGCTPALHAKRVLHTWDDPWGAHGNWGSGWEPRGWELDGGHWKRLIPLGTHILPWGSCIHPPPPPWRWRRRSRSRGDQTNTLYSIVTTARITVSRAGQSRSRQRRIPGPGRGCPSATILFLQDNSYRFLHYHEHDKGDPERWRPCGGCAGALPAPGAPGPLGRRRGGSFLRESVEGAPGPRVMLGTKGPLQDQEMQPRQSTRVMRDPHRSLRPCRYLGALASPWMGTEGGRLRRGAAACPEKAPRCWSRSVHIGEPHALPKTLLMQGWGSGCSWCGAAQGVGRQSPPCLRHHGWPGADLAFPCGGIWVR